MAVTLRVLLVSTSASELRSLDFEDHRIAAVAGPRPHNASCDVPDPPISAVSYSARNPSP